MGNVGKLENSKKQRMAIKTGSAYTIRPFVPKVSEFLISKLYFIEAAEAYVASAPLGYRSGFASHALWPCANVLHAFCTVVEVPVYFAKYCAKMPRLRRLQLDISVHEFTDEDDILPVSGRVLTEDDFQQSTLIVDLELEQFRSLPKAELRPRNLFSATSIKEEIWRTNIKLPEKVLNRVLLARKDSDHHRVGLAKSLDPGGELYRGSAVCLDAIIPLSPSCTDCSTSGWVFEAARRRDALECNGL